jgi:hypothetical protein
MATIQMSEEVKAFLKALSKLTALYENNPDLPVPYLGNINVFPETREELALIARKTAYLKPKKVANDDYYFKIAIDLAPGIELHYNMERTKVCERVQVGTKLVDVPAKPAEDAKTIEVPQYEWKCADSILAPGVGK